MASQQDPFPAATEREPPEINFWKLWNFCSCLLQKYISAANSYRNNLWDLSLVISITFLGFDFTIYFCFIFVNNSDHSRIKFQKRFHIGHAFAKEICDNLEPAHFMKMCFMLDFWNLFIWSFFMAIQNSAHLIYLHWSNYCLSVDISSFHNVSFVWWLIIICDWSFITRCLGSFMIFRIAKVYLVWFSIDFPSFGYLWLITIWYDFDLMK